VAAFSQKGSKMIFLEWEADPEFRHATAGEHIIVGPYELVAFDIPPSTVMGRKIGWQIFAGARRIYRVATGTSDAFKNARTAAEKGLMKLLDLEPVCWHKVTGLDAEYAVVGPKKEFELLVSKSGSDPAAWRLSTGIKYRRVVDRAYASRFDFAKIFAETALVEYAAGLSQAERKALQQ
jgi:hypothetical protein